jgi:hypothetical protein
MYQRLKKKKSVTKRNHNKRVLICLPFFQNTDVCVSAMSCVFAAAGVILQWVISTWMASCYALVYAWYLALIISWLNESVEYPDLIVYFLLIKYEYLLFQNFCFCIFYLRFEITHLSFRKDCIGNRLIFGIFIMGFCSFLLLELYVDKTWCFGKSLLLSVLH